MGEARTIDNPIEIWKIPSGGGFVIWYVLDKDIPPDEHGQELWLCAGGFPNDDGYEKEQPCFADDMMYLGKCIFMEKFDGPFDPEAKYQDYTGQDERKEIGNG